MHPIFMKSFDREYIYRMITARFISILCRRSCRYAHDQHMDVVWFSQPSEFFSLIDEMIRNFVSLETIRKGLNGRGVQFFHGDPWCGVARSPVPEMTRTSHLNELHFVGNRANRSV